MTQFKGLSKELSAGRQLNQQNNLIQLQSMINYLDTYEMQAPIGSGLCELEFQALASSSSLTHYCEHLTNADSFSCGGHLAENIEEVWLEQGAKRTANRRRPTKKIQYTYHKKKKRPAPKPLIHVKEDGLKVCLIIEKPKSNAHPFSIQEDRRILELVLRLGPKFYKIAKQFPGKSISMVKNRYYKHLRYQWEAVLGSKYKHLSVARAEGDSGEESEVEASGGDSAAK